MDGEVEEVDDEYGEKMTEFIAVAETAVMSADDASAQGKGEGELWTRLQATKAGLDKLVKFFGEQSSHMRHVLMDLDGQKRFLSSRSA